MVLRKELYEQIWILKTLLDCVGSKATYKL